MTPVDCVCAYVAPVAHFPLCTPTGCFASYEDAFGLVAPRTENGAVETTILAATVLALALYRALSSFARKP